VAAPVPEWPLSSAPLPSPSPLQLPSEIVQVAAPVPKKPPSRETLRVLGVTQDLEGNAYTYTFTHTHTHTHKHKHKHKHTHTHTHAHTHIHTHTFK
jgi:hypothetical protein